MVAYHPESGTWLLCTEHTSYALREVENTIRHVYWGPRLSLDQAATIPVPTGEDVLGEELPGEGGTRFGPASIRLEFADGVRAVEWRPAGYQIDGDELRIRLADRHYPIEVELRYRVLSDVDVIERSVALRHTGSGEPVAVECLDSAAWTIPFRPEYRMSYVSGEWAADFQLQRQVVPRGETVLTSRRGSPRHQLNPWLMVDPDDATEEHGEVWGVALAWSGSFHLTVRRTLRDHLAISAGEGHEGVRWHLRPGEEWVTPVCAGLYTEDGYGAASRAWHEYARCHVLPVADELRPVLYNSWEGTWFDVDEPGLREVAKIAAELGTELFVVDDGWFHLRTSDRAGLGDWWPDPDRFPHGLRPLADEVHRLGMAFGLWVEPEMVNPDSELYRAHPDWVLYMPNRHRTELRGQLVLNFARPDVADWAHQWLSRLVAGNGIDFLKWDMNRAFTEAGWPGAADPGRLWSGHTRAVYALHDRLRRAHPELRIEGCASGGGRADFGLMRRTDQVWTSDNTDPVDRIGIQYGFSQAYPAIAMGAWASDSPNPVNRRATPLRFRFHVAMAGALGISGNLREWTVEDRREAAALVAQYKEIRHIVHHGHQYRLTPADAPTVAVQYLSEDGGESLVLAWRPVWHPGQPQGPLRLRGLDPSATYSTGSATYPGAVLLAHGMAVDLPKTDYGSALIHLRRS